MILWFELNFSPLWFRKPLLGCRSIESFGCLAWRCRAELFDIIYLPNLTSSVLYGFFGGNELELIPSFLFSLSKIRK